MPELKTALLITYYWPPSGGPGVHRWLKMAKYLPDYDWQLIVVTPENPERPALDESLLEDLQPVHRTVYRPIWEPYGIYKLLNRRRRKQVYSHFISDASKPTALQKLAAWIRGNLLIPDPRRLWVRPTSKYLRGQLGQLNPDVIISTGPPHSMHLIGKALHRASGIPWIADFRDPWTEVYYFSRLKLSWLARKYHEKLERSVLTQASKVVTVSNSWAEGLAKLSGRTIDVVHNGFDHADFATDTQLPPEPLTISYFGSMGRERNPEALWRAIAEINKANDSASSAIRVICYGAVDGSVLASARSYGVIEQLEVHPYIPHRDAVAIMRTSGLLLSVNQDASLGVVPGKLYEYLGSRRPILMIGNPLGDAARIVRKFEAGWIADFDDHRTVGDILRELIVNQDLPVRTDANIQEFTRKQLAAQYAAIMLSTSSAVRADHQ